MASAGNQARSALAAGETKVSELARKVGRDRRKEARVQRVWSILQILLGAAFSLVARRLAERAWALLTGEQPSIRGHAGEPARDLPGSDSEEAAPEPDPDGHTRRLEEVDAALLERRSRAFAARGMSRRGMRGRSRPR